MLVIQLSPDMENQLLKLSEQLNTSQDFLINQAIEQYLINFDNYFQLTNKKIAVEQPTKTKKHAVSRAGALARYANPQLITQEKSAWADAMREKHGHL